MRRLRNKGSMLLAVGIIFFAAIGILVGSQMMKQKRRTHTIDYEKVKEQLVTSSMAAYTAARVSFVANRDAMTNRINQFFHNAASMNPSKDLELFKNTLSSEENALYFALIRPYKISNPGRSNALTGYEAYSFDFSTDGENSVSRDLSFLLKDLDFEGRLASAEIKARFTNMQAIAAQENGQFIDYKVVDVNTAPPNMYPRLRHFLSGTGTVPVMDIVPPSIDLASLLNLNMNVTEIVTGIPEPAVNVNLPIGRWLGLHKYNLTEHVLKFIFGPNMRIPFTIGFTSKELDMNVFDALYPETFSRSADKSDMINNTAQWAMEKKATLEFTGKIITKDGEEILVSPRYIEFTVADIQPVAPCYSFFVQNSQDQQINFNGGGHFFVNSSSLKMIWDGVKNQLNESVPDMSFPGSIRVNGTKEMTVNPGLLGYESHNGSFTLASPPENFYETNNKILYDANTTFEKTMAPIQVAGNSIVHALRYTDFLLGAHPAWYLKPDWIKGFVPLNILTADGITTVIDIIMRIFDGVKKAYDENRSVTVADMSTVFFNSHFLNFWFPYVPPETIFGLLKNIIMENMPQGGFSGWIAEKGVDFVLTPLDEATKKISTAEGKYMADGPGQETVEPKYFFYNVPNFGWKFNRSHLFGEFALFPPFDRQCEGFIRKQTTRMFNFAAYAKIPIVPYVLPFFFSMTQVDDGKYTYAYFPFTPGLIGVNAAQYFLGGPPDDKATTGPTTEQQMEQTRKGLLERNWFSKKSLFSSGKEIFKNFKSQWDKIFVFANTTAPKDSDDPNECTMFQKYVQTDDIENHGGAFDPADPLNGPRNLYHESQYKQKASYYYNGSEDFRNNFSRHLDRNGNFRVSGIIFIEGDGAYITLPAMKVIGKGAIVSDVNIVLEGNITQNDINPQSGTDINTRFSIISTRGAIVHRTPKDITVEANLYGKMGIHNSMSYFNITGNLVCDTFRKFKLEGSGQEDYISGNVIVTYDSVKSRASLLSVKPGEGKYDPRRYVVTFVEKQPVAQMGDPM